VRTTSTGTALRMSCFRIWHLTIVFRFVSGRAA
jgi:hypothetical protein